MGKIAFLLLCTVLYARIVKILFVISPHGMNIKIASFTLYLEIKVQKPSNMTHNSQNVSNETNEERERERQRDIQKNWVKY